MPEHGVGEKTEGAGLQYTLNVFAGMILYDLWQKDKAELALLISPWPSNNSQTHTGRTHLLEHVLQLMQNNHFTYWFPSHW